jgi:hypothetical protein
LPFLTRTRRRRRRRRRRRKEKSKRFNGGNDVITLDER